MYNSLYHKSPKSNSFLFPALYLKHTWWPDIPRHKKTDIIVPVRHELGDIGDDFGGCFTRLVGAFKGIPGGTVDSLSWNKIGRSRVWSSCCCWGGGRGCLASCRWSGCGCRTCRGTWRARVWWRSNRFLRWHNRLLTLDLTCVRSQMPLILVLIVTLAELTRHSLPLMSISIWVSASTWVSPKETESLTSRFTPGPKVKHRYWRRRCFGWSRLLGLRKRQRTKNKTWNCRCSRVESMLLSACQWGHELRKKKKTWGSRDITWNSQTLCGSKQQTQQSQRLIHHFHSNRNS